MPRALGGLDHDLRAVDVAGDDVDALVDQAVGGFGFLDRQRPVAGEDRPGVVIFGFDRARAEREGVDVAQHLRDRLGGDEAELARSWWSWPATMPVRYWRLVDVAEVAADVLRVLALGPQAAAVEELHRRGTSRPSSACAGRSSRTRSGRASVAPSRLIMLSIVFWTSTVSGTFSSSTTFTPAIFFSDGRALGMGLVVAVVVASGRHR